MANRGAYWWLWGGHRKGLLRGLDCGPSNGRPRRDRPGVTGERACHGATSGAATRGARLARSLWDIVCYYVTMCREIKWRE